MAAFGLLTAWLTGRPHRLLRRGAVLVTGADLGWVAGSAVLLVWRPPSLQGAVATTAVAGTVAALAVRQIAALAATQQVIDLPTATSNR